MKLMLLSANGVCLVEAIAALFKPIEYLHSTCGGAFKRKLTASFIC